jgi:hypothetical protein
VYGVQFQSVSICSLVSSLSHIYGRLTFEKDWISLKGMGIAEEQVEKKQGWKPLK